MVAVSFPSQWAHSRARYSKRTHQWSQPVVSPVPQKWTGGHVSHFTTNTFLSHYSVSATDVQVNKQAVTRGMVGPGGGPAPLA